MVFGQVYLSKATAALSLPSQGQVILKPFCHNCCHKSTHRVHVNPRFERDSKDPYKDLSSTVYADIKFPMYIFAVKSITFFAIVFFPILLINLMLVREVCDSQEKRARSQNSYKPMSKLLLYVTSMLLLSCFQRPPLNVTLRSEEYGGRGSENCCQ